MAAGWHRSLTCARAAQVEDLGHGDHRRTDRLRSSSFGESAAALAKAEARPYLRLGIRGNIWSIMAAS